MSQSKVWRRIGALLADDAFPIQSRVFEIQKQRQFQARDVQVADHLRSVRFIKTSDDLGINDNCAVHNLIRKPCPNQLLPKVNGIRPLHFDLMPGLS